MNQILSINKLELFNFDMKDDYILSDIHYNLCKTIFRTHTKKPETKEAFIKLIVQLYKNILSNDAILTEMHQKKDKVNGKQIQKRIYNYKLNWLLISLMYQMD